MLHGVVVRPDLDSLWSFATLAGGHRLLVRNRMIAPVRADASTGTVPRFEPSAANRAKGPFLPSRASPPQCGEPFPLFLLHYAGPNYNSTKVCFAYFGLCPRRTQRKAKPLLLLLTARPTCTSPNCPNE